jgi:prepilin-type N-terminal cleavage/methylation domain-containing protein
MTRRRGMTLIEIMLVVAIIGIISAISAVGVTRLTAFGRVNGTAGQLQRLLANARLRAVTTQCPHYVIINGPDFAGTSVAGAPRTVAAAFMLRKANCQSTELGYEAGSTPEERDAVVSTMLLAEPSAGLEYTFPPPIAVLGANGVLIEYSTLGQRRMGSNGVTCEAGSCPALPMPPEISISVQDANQYTRRSVLLPASGSARIGD